MNMYLLQKLFLCFSKWGNKENRFLNISHPEGNEVAEQIQILSTFPVGMRYQQLPSNIYIFLDCDLSC